MQSIPIRLNDGYGMTVKESGNAGHIRFVDSHGVPYTVDRKDLDIILGAKSMYVLIGKAYPENNRLEEDKVALRKLHELDLHH